MFTGIIEGLGTIIGTHAQGQGRRVVIDAGFDLSDSRIGDSIAVNGACMTAIRLDGSRFEVDVSPESVSRTLLGQARIGERVNLERALRLSDRLDGHLVSGHVDGTGLIAGRRPHDNAVIVTVSVSQDLTEWMIPKGSVAVDGISLTINALAPDRFTVSIIPHTAKLTTIGFKAVGDPVNIETDLIGKYVKRFVTGSTGPAKKADAAVLNLDFLQKTGFL